MSCPDYIHLHLNETRNLPHPSVALRHYRGPIYLVADPGSQGATRGAVLSFGRGLWQAYDEQGRLLAGGLPTRERAIEFVTER